MITFLSPLFLIGLLAAGIPLIIHLSRSRRTKKMRFSTTRFFTDQFLRSYRMSRLKEILLLVCRMALCAFLAIALARPLFLPKSQPLFSGGPRNVVLVLDNSASMGVIENGQPLLEKAKSAARDILAGLRPEDRASIVLAGRKATGPEALFPEPTSQFGDVLQAINALQVSSLGTDLTNAVVRAEAIAMSGTASSREVYVLSDLQTSGFEQPDPSTIAPQHSDVLFFFAGIRPKHPANVAVTAIQYAASRPMVGVPFALRPHLSVQGGQAGSVVVRLFVDGQKVGERTVTKSSNGRWAIPRFYHTFTTGGWHSGYVEVDDEVMPADNRRYFTLEVLDSVKVLAVNGAPSQVPRLDELFFLRFALTAGPEGRSPIQVDTIGPQDIANTDLSKYPLVIAANVETFPAPAVEKLEAFADKGGSLLLFLGDKVNATAYNQNLAAPSRLHGGLLPGRLTDIKGNPAAEDTFATVGEVDFDHVALAAFQEPRFAGLGGVTLKAFWTVEPATGTTVPMRTSTKAPLLLEKEFGKGRVMLFTSTADRDWTNFPVRPTFLPWLHRMTAYLAQEPFGRQSFYATGDHVPVPISAVEGLQQVLVRKPDGNAGHAVMGDDPASPLFFGDTSQVGVYTLLVGDKKDPAGMFAVNVESYESDLSYLDDYLVEHHPDSGGTKEAKIVAGLSELMQGRRAELITYVDDPSRVGEVGLGSRRGIKMWDVVLIVVLLLALVEPWLANRISLLHYGKAKEVIAGGRPGEVRRPSEVPAPETKEVGAR